VVTGLRERKKRETRRSISDIATTLFMTKGFDNTTITEIAEAAGVSPQTVANYFPTKTDLFFDEDGWRGGPPAAIVEHCPTIAPADAVLRWLLSDLRRRDDDGHLAGQAAFRQTIFASPALRHRYFDDVAELKNALHDAIAATSPRLPGWRVGLTATTLTGALITCEEEFASLSTELAPERLLAATSGAAKKILNRVHLNLP
jgi:AcrR family transcriptional regulator